MKCKLFLLLILSTFLIVGINAVQAADETTPAPSPTATLIVGVSPGGSGTTVPSGASVQEKNTNIPISATPGSSWAFSHWSVDLAGHATFADANSASTTVRISNDASITANFDMILDTTITASPTSPYPDTNVRLEFNANVPVSYFYCRLYPLESGYTKTTLNWRDYFNLEEGNYTFIVFARGADGALETTPDTYSFTIDVPEGDINTWITSGPDYVDNDGDVAFEYTTNLPAQAYYYKLAGLETAYTKTTSTTVSYEDLVDGAYQFVVFARSDTGVLETTPARWSFNVLAQDIDTNIVLGPSAVSTDGNVTFQWEANKEVLWYYYRLYPLENGYTKTTETTIDYTGLQNGDYTFIIFARDIDGVLETEAERYNFSVQLSSSAPESSGDVSAAAGEPLLVEVYPNAQADAETISLFKYVQFTLEQDSVVNIEVAATCAAGENDDDLVVALRGAGEAVTIMAFNGDDIAGAVASKLAQVNLAAGDYTLEVYAEGTPTLNTVKISTAPLTDLLDARINAVPAGAELGLFKEFLFDGAGDLTLEIIAKADAGDDVVVYLDGVSYGIDTATSIDGDTAQGEVQVLDIPVSELAAGEHTLSLVTQGSPTIIAVRVLISE